MNYELNSTVSFIRILIFTAAGDGILSKEELNEVIEANTSLESRFEFSAGFMGAMKGAFLEAFGIESDEEEEEEEEEVNLAELSQEEVDNIVEDVLSQLSKCSTASDLKAYSSLICSKMTDDTLVGWACQASFDISRADHVDTLIDDKELRNIKYIHKDLNQDFKENHTKYLHSLTWYDDYYLQNYKGEIDLKVVDGDIDPTAVLIMKAAFAVTFADWHLTVTNTQFSGTYFMALCDLARSNKSSEVVVPSVEVVFEKVQLAVEEIENHMKSELGMEKIETAIETSRSMWEKINNEEDADEEVDKIHAFEGEFGESMNKYIKNLIKDVTDVKTQKVLYKICYLLAEADDDRAALHRVVVHDASDMFSSGGMGEGTVDEHSMQERAALYLIEECFDFDEDILYALKGRLESGEYRGL